MLKKKKKQQLALLICTLIIMASTCTLAVLGSKGLLDHYAAWGVLAVVGGLYAILGFLIALHELFIALNLQTAINECTPGRMITQDEYRHFNPGKQNQELLDRITAHKLTADEAHGIGRLAQKARLFSLQYAAALLVLAAILTTIAITTPQPIIAIETPTDITSLKLLMLYAPRVTAALFILIAVRLLWQRRRMTPYITAVQNSYTEEYIKENEQRLAAVIAEIHEKTIRPLIRLTLQQADGDIFASKLGGKPYLPPGFAYPQNADGPLHLLAQLNFEQLPKLPDFPQTGILQIFIADNDMLGKSHTLLTEQIDFRVIYHAEILRDESILQTPPTLTKTHNTFPLAEELTLHGQLEQTIISADDFRFAEMIVAAYHRVYAADDASFYDLPNDVGHLIDMLDNNGGHQMGGYPVFTQGDPREGHSSYLHYTEVLLQIDSDWENNIYFGDFGTANFLITPDQLKARDFSHVLYTWDCY